MASVVFTEPVQKTTTTLFEKKPMISLHHSRLFLYSAENSAFGAIIPLQMNDEL